MKNKEIIVDFNKYIELKNRALKQEKVILIVAALSSLLLVVTSVLQISIGIIKIIPDYFPLILYSLTLVMILYSTFQLFNFKSIKGKISKTVDILDGISEDFQYLVPINSTKFRESKGLVWTGKNIPKLSRYINLVDEMNYFVASDTMDLLTKEERIKFMRIISDSSIDCIALKDVEDSTFSVEVKVIYRDFDISYLFHPEQSFLDYNFKELDSNVKNKNDLMIENAIKKRIWFLFSFGLKCLYWFFRLSWRDFYGMQHFWMLWIRLNLLSF